MNEVEFYLEDLKSKFKKINPQDYVLAYSGGRDSHFIYWFLKEWLFKNDIEMWKEYLQIEIVGLNTYMEHPEILKRIKQHCDVILLPKMKPKEIKEKFGSPCFSKIQDEFINRYQKGSRSKNTMKVINGDNVFFNLNDIARQLTLEEKIHNISNKCCDYLKKKPMKEYLKQANKNTIVGIRASESKLRNSKYKSCFDKNGQFSPLWDLTDELMKMIEKEYNIPIPNVYDVLDRTGCMGCPYGKNIQKELKLLKPNQRKFIIDYHKESYNVKNIDYKNIQTDIFDFIEEE